MNFFKNLINKIKKYISNLTSIQKLIVSIVFVVVIALIVKLLFEGLLREPYIDYKNIDGVNIEIESSYIDNNTYAMIKKISDEVITVFAGTQPVYKNNIEYTINKMYDHCLYNEYKSFISKKKFKNKITEFMQGIEYDGTNAIPSDISMYKNNYYIITYTNSEDINHYLGIAINYDNGSYYIWYLE